MSENWADMMDALTGEWVEVIYSKDPKKSQIGRLIDFDLEGEVEIRDKYAITHYIWPCLEIEKV